MTEKTDERLNEIIHLEDKSIQEDGLSDLNEVIHLTEKKKDQKGENLNEQKSTL